MRLIIGTKIYPQQGLLTFDAHPIGILSACGIPQAAYERPLWYWQICPHHMHGLQLGLGQFAVKSLLGCSRYKLQKYLHLHCRLAQLLFILSAVDTNRASCKHNSRALGQPRSNARHTHHHHLVIIFAIHQRWNISGRKSGLHPVHNTRQNSVPRGFLTNSVQHGKRTHASS